MAYFMTTPLGREVAVGDWNAFYRDEILRLLYDFQRVPFNDGTLTYSLAAICNATRLDLTPAASLALNLVQDGLAEQPSPYNFRITALGVQFVHAAMANPFTGSL